MAATASNQVSANPAPVATTSAAASETPHDLFCLAREYDRNGRPYDAANLYLKASLNGHLNAMVAYAKHIAISDERNAFVWYRAAAERGDARAWAELGQLLASGSYFEPNAVDAARCWKRAAQMGDNKGKCCLGLCYVRGYGVRQDPDKGLEIMRQVADVHNDVTAMRNLAWIYREGTDVPRNLKDAEYWQQRAKTQEEKMAQLSSREHALFGRNRSSRSTRSARYKSRSHHPYSHLQPAPQPQPQSREQVRTLEQQEGEQQASTEKSTVDDSTAQSHFQSTYDASQKPHSANATVLEEADVESRLKGLADDPSRQTEDDVPRTETVSAPTQLDEPRDSQLSSAPVQATSERQVIPPSSAADSQLANADAPEVLVTSLIAGDTVEEDLPREYTETTPQEVIPTVTETTVKRDADPQLGAEVAGLNFVEKVSATTSRDSNVLATSAAVASQEALSTVPQSTYLEASTQGFVSAQPTLAQPLASVTQVPEVTGLASSRPVPSRDENGDEQFVTPEQSLENEETTGSYKKVAAVAVGAAGATAAVGAAASTHIGGRLKEGVQDTQETFGERDQYGEDTHLATTAALDSARQGELPGYSEYADEELEGEITRVRESDEEPLDQTGLQDKGHEYVQEARLGETATHTYLPGEDHSISVRDSSASAQGAGYPEYENTDTQDEAGDATLTSGIKSRAMFFEHHAAMDDMQQAEEAGTRQHASNIASSMQPGVVQQRSALIEESERIENGNPAEAIGRTRLDPSAPLSYPTHRPLSYSIMRGAPYASNGQGTRLSTRDLDGKFASTGDLEKVLGTYPENPMREDSRSDLHNFLKGLQGFPVTSPQALSVLENGRAFPKVIVALVAHAEDEAIQEEGLHAFVRIMRVTQGSARESQMSMSYGDCFRTVTDNPQSVVPQGSLGIDEKASGAVQAVAQALRTHSDVRRVQLAGCAALGEVAAVSSSSRTLAYENGATSLVLNCLRHRSTKAAATIHDVAARTVSAFCTGTENFVFKEAFSNAGAIPALLGVLRLWGHSAEDKSELTTTVVKNICSALRHITEGCAVASAQCVQSYAYHHLVRVMVLYRDDVTVCILVVTALTSITRYAGSLAEKGLLDAKPLREVLVTMQKHSDSPLFIRKALDFMDSLANFPSMRDELVEEGGIPFAADIIGQNSNDSLLLERACSVAEKLCRGNQKNQDLFGSSNGVQSLVELLKSQQALPGVAERTLMATSSVCANNVKNQKHAVKCGTPEVITRTLNAYCGKNAKVVAASISAMTSLVTPKNAATAREFADIQAPDFVIRAMKKFPDSMAVQENGSTAIAAFCESDPAIIATLLKSGISSILVVALQRYLHKQSAVVQIARAMRALTNEASSEASYRFKTKLLTDRSNESSLSEIFHTALSYHKKALPESANVIISICATINRLCMRSVTFKNEVGKDGIVEELKRLVEKTAAYHEIGALQPVLATICTLVLDSEENKNRFHQVDGVEAILDVMQKWRSDTYVLEHCCAALRYSCNDHFGNCDHVKHHNGVRSITGVMTRHSQNVNVMMWCCLTLADLCKGDEDVQSSRQVIEGIRKVISAMSTFAENSRFLASACEFLRAASQDHDTNQDRIVRLGGRTAIVKALEAHPGNSTLTESGSYALVQIQDITDPRTSLDGNASRTGIMQRFSKELRRSSSSKSNPNVKTGIPTRKSFSFSRRKQAVVEEEDPTPVQETPAVEAPATRTTLLGFSRTSRLRRRRRVPKQEIEELPEGEEIPPVQDGYEDIPIAEEADASPIQQMD